MRLSYEATDVGSWSFVGSNFPVRNELMIEMIYEMNHIQNCGYEIKLSYDPRSSGAILAIAFVRPFFFCAVTARRRHLSVLCFRCALHNLGTLFKCLVVLALEH